MSPRLAAPPAAPSMGTAELFSDAYLSLRRRFLNPGRRAEDDAFRDAPALSEKTFRVVWYENRYERRGLRTVDGRRVGVAVPGEWNLDEGPDFRGAEVRIEDDVRRGDVELHLKDRDWKHHGHDADPAYDNVVLHVFLQPSRAPAEIRNSRGELVPSVCLAGRLPEPWSALVQSFDASGYPFESACGLGACGQKVNVQKYDAVGRLLDLAGDGRVLLRGPAAGEDAEEALYLRLAESMGYRRNKAAMSRLARRLPWRELGKECRTRPAGERAEWLEAVFFGAAGLLPPPGGPLDAEGRETAARFAKLWTSSRFFEPAPEPAGWVFHGVRPQNFPHRRLAGLARLLARFAEGGSLADGARGPADLVVPASGYFASRARWGAKRFARPAALVGPDRAQAVWVSVFLPRSVAAARAAADAGREAGLHEAYARLPLKEANGVARLMAHRLLGSERSRGFRLSAERRQQGLLQIFQDFCDTKPWACRACALPKLLDLSVAELNRGR